VGKVSTYPTITSPTPTLHLLGSDIANFAESSTGTTETIPVVNLLPGVVWPSGDPSGVKDAAAINAALAAGVKFIYLVASAPWYILCGQISINGSAVWINAPGCYIYAVGAGDMIRMYDSSSYGSGRPLVGGGLIGMPMIDGVNTNGNSCAFHAGDILQLAVFAQAKNFTAGTTSKGFWLDNNYYWTEMVFGHIFVWGNTTGVMFDNSANTSGSATGSFDRLNMDICGETNNGIGDLVTFNNSAFSIGGRLGIYGNMSPSSNGVVYYVLKFLGSSYLEHMTLNFDVEMDGSGGTTPSTIYFTASPYNYIQGCIGMMDFGAASPMTPAPHNNCNFQFAGPVFGDSTLVPLPYLGPVSVTTAVTGNGQTFYCDFASLFYLTGGTSYTGLIIYGGGFDGQPLTIVNTGTGTFTFAASGTSNVAQGTAVSLAPGARRDFNWNSARSLWY
jgi:hypothetical protein